MESKTLVEAVDERLASIAALLASIEQGGGSADLRDLALNLVDAMKLLQGVFSTGTRAEAGNGEPGR